MKIITVLYKILQIYANSFQSSLAMSTVKPKLIVFDLDYTLWPFWVDTHVTPPFRKTEKGVVDAHNHKIKYYNEVPEMLETLKKENYKLGIASRTSEIKGANHLLQLFDWDKYFEYKEIYPGRKTEHFNNFRKKSGIDYKDMLFFDDEHRNIADLNKIGVVSILVGDGMNLKVLAQGLEEYKQKRTKPF